jgi:MSHA biogenesis protein MshM
MPKLATDDIIEFIRAEFDRAGLPHSTFSDDATALIARSAQGVLRHVRNLCLAVLLEALRDRVRTVDLKHVNRALLQPHWREPRDLP